MIEKLIHFVKSSFRPGILNINKEAYLRAVRNRIIFWFIYNFYSVYIYIFLEKKINR